MSNSDRTSTVDVIRYHDRTKHHYDRYARSPGYMDWANQPVPFRIYHDVQTIELPFIRKEPDANHLELYQAAGQSARKIELETIAGLLELSVGLSAWKAAGQSRWSLRINPSSGNLHPTETYLILPEINGYSAGVYHYNPLYHELGKRAVLPEERLDQLRTHFQSEGFLVGLSSIFWRESWKYGERALRYCNHDVGHAVAAIRLAANLFGWKLKWLDAVSDEALEQVLGINQATYPQLEEEHPDLMCWIYPPGPETMPSDLPPDFPDALSAINFEGRPNQLSHKRVDWEIIGRTAQQTRKPRSTPLPSALIHAYEFEAKEGSSAATDLIRSRRSATAFSPDGSISRQDFLEILEKTLPRSDRAPFDWGHLPVSTHLILFVHAVQRLPSGLYALIRCEQDLESLKDKCQPDFQWSKSDDRLPLYLLEEGNFRQTATMLSCHQSIAGESAFSLGMLARFRQNIETAPYRYRWLFWEAGIIGQILYLEAEAHGMRGTGIGCYFDDAVHDLLGLKENSFQSMYHFTVGMPIEDDRLTTLPPYFHLENRT